MEIFSGRGEISKHFDKALWIYSRRANCYCKGSVYVSKAGCKGEAMDKTYSETMDLTTNGGYAPWPQNLPISAYPHLWEWVSD